MNKSKKSRNTPHSHAGYYRLVSEGERDSDFLHNNGQNKWPVTPKSPEEIEEALSKLHR